MQFRVLWLTENYFPNRGGMAQSCDRIVQGLRKKGIRIDIVHFCSRGEAYRWQQQQEGRYLACPVEKDRAHTLNRLWQYIASEDFSYTHLLAFGGNLPILAASVWPIWMNLPLITLFRGNDFDSALFSYNRQPVLLRALQQSTAVGAVSHDKVEKLKQLVPRSKVFYSPNGIDTQNWQLSPSDLAHAARWKKEQAAGKKVIGLFGQLKAKKGIPVFLEALKRSGLVADLHLLLVGDIDSDLQCQLSNLPQLSYSCLPFMDRFELLGYYPACDAVAIPSFYDGMPNVMLESGALGIPLLVSCTDGMKDVLGLKEEPLAWLFRSGDTADATRALRAWAGCSAEEITQKARNCQDHIIQNYSTAKETEIYLKILMETAQP